MIKIVGVRFRSAGKVYYFDPKEFEIRIGDHVIVETARGPEYGVAAGRIKDVEDDMVSLPLREVVRLATPEDEDKIVELRAKEKEALKTCREKVHEHKLDMKMVDAEYSFDGSKILFYFTADGRIDFRDLVKDLAGIYHMRIELRQIGVRDETKLLGGIGACGRELCCATYLSDFAPVSIKMAKEQNLSLNPAKISGVCGRLMCCLKNEEDTYEFLNAKMPKMGEEATTADGKTGKVIELSILRQKVKVLFEEGDSKSIEEFPVEELTFRPRKHRDDRPQNGQKQGGKGERPERVPGGERPERGPKKERPERGPKKDRQDKPASAGINDESENAAYGFKAEDPAAAEPESDAAGTGQGGNGAETDRVPEETAYTVPGFTEETEETEAIEETADAAYLIADETEEAGSIEEAADAADLIADETEEAGSIEEAADAAPVPGEEAEDAEAAEETADAALMPGEEAEDAEAAEAAPEAPPATEGEAEEAGAKEETAEAAPVPEKFLRNAENGRRMHPRRRHSQLEDSKGRFDEFGQNPREGGHSRENGRRNPWDKDRSRETAGRRRGEDASGMGERRRDEEVSAMEGRRGDEDASGMDGQRRQEREGSVSRRRHEGGGRDMAGRRQEGEGSVPRRRREGGDRDMAGRRHEEGEGNVPRRRREGGERDMSGQRREEGEEYITRRRREDGDRQMTGRRPDDRRQRPEHGSKHFSGEGKRPEKPSGPLTADRERMPGDSTQAEKGHRRNSAERQDRGIRRPHGQVQQAGRPDRAGKPRVPGTVQSDSEARPLKPEGLPQGTMQPSAAGPSRGTMQTPAASPSQGDIRQPSDKSHEMKIYKND